TRSPPSSSCAELISYPKLTSLNGMLWLCSFSNCMVKHFLSPRYFGVFGSFPSACLCIGHAFSPASLASYWWLNASTFWQSVLHPCWCHNTKILSIDGRGRSILEN